MSVCSCFLFLCEKRNLYTLSTQLVVNPQIWNLYLEFSLQARLSKWVPTLELWADSILENV